MAGVRAGAGGSSSRPGFTGPCGGWERGKGEGEDEGREGTGPGIVSEWGRDVIGSRL